MGIRPTFNPSGEGGAVEVDKYIDTAYDNVKVVADSIESILVVEANLDTIQHYLGAYADAPNLRPNGDPLEVGDYFVNTTTVDLEYLTELDPNTWIAVNYQDVVNAVSQAQAAAIAADLSAVSASTSETNAGISESNASTSETNSKVSEVNAGNSETASATSETNSGISEANALASANASAISESNALASEVASSTSETNAGLSETNAGTSETNALVSELRANQWAEFPEDSEIAPGQYSALHWAAKAQANANATFVSGGLFTPTAGAEYPTPADPSVDTLWIVSFPTSGETYTYTAGDLIGQTAHNGDQIFFDDPSDVYGLILSGIGGAVTSVNGKAGPSVTINSPDIVHEATTVNNKFLELDAAISGITGWDPSTVSPVAIGVGSGVTAQGVLSVAVGEDAGNTAQGSYSVAVGPNAGRSGQSSGAVAVGASAGKTSQGSNSISVGGSAGFTNQGAQAVALGVQAGQDDQGTVAIAVGYGAGKTTQSTKSIAIGNDAGSLTQGANSVAVGFNAGKTSQSNNCVSVGDNAGSSTQGAYAVAVGNNSGSIDQGASAVAMGDDAGKVTQGVSSVAVGQKAGRESQGTQSIAVGYYSGRIEQGAQSIAIGSASGMAYQGIGAVAIGFKAGWHPLLDLANGQGARSLIISSASNGYTTTAEDSITLISDTGSIKYNGVDSWTFAGGDVRSSGPQGTDDSSLTRKDYVDGLDAKNVKLTGAQTIVGDKTFVDRPLLNAGVKYPATDEDNSVWTQRNQGGGSNHMFQHQDDVQGVTSILTLGRTVSSFGITTDVRSNYTGPMNTASLTRKDYVDDLDVENVKITGNQTIAGAKEFTSPVTVATPTTAQHATTKSWVEGAIVDAVDPLDTRIGANETSVYDLERRVATNNVKVGTNAGQTSQGGWGVAIGGYAAETSQGAWSVAVGSSAGMTGQGDDAVALGTSAGNSSQGNKSVALGCNAGKTSQGDFAVAIGYQAGLTNQFANSVCLGNSSSVTATYQVQLGRAGTTTFAYGSVQDRSDSRDKTEITPSDLGLDFINLLRPVKYLWDRREEYREEGQLLRDVVSDGTKRGKRFHYGLIAQEVKATADSLDIDFGGYQDHSINGGDDVKSLGYAELISPLIKAIQELTARVVELEATNKDNT